MSDTIAERYDELNEMLEAWRRSHIDWLKPGEIARQYNYIKSIYDQMAENTQRRYVIQKDSHTAPYPINLLKT